MGRKSYPPEMRDRVVRMVFEHRDEYDSQWAAIVSISSWQFIATLACANTLAAASKALSFLFVPPSVAFAACRPSREISSTIRR